MNTLRLLLIGDIHYRGRALHECKIPERETEYGLEFIRRVLRASRPEAFDAVVVLGDAVDNGPAEGADADLRELADEVRNFGAPSFFVRGNHDCPESVFREAAGRLPDSLVIGDYLLYFFNDEYFEDGSCRRSEEDIGRYMEAVRDNPGKKPVVFQHSPVFPKIESDYPYNLLNAGQVHASYRDSGVRFSVSGHYHKGLDLFSKDGTGYLIVPALSEFPYPYIQIELKESGINLSKKALAPAGLLWDNHCHTELAYCGEDVSVESVCGRVGLFKMEYAGFAEHSGQLYLPPENYWAGDFYNRPGLIRQARENGFDRVSEYKKKVREFGGRIARLGFEVEADKNGALTLLPEDRAGVDFLIGAVHFLPEAGKRGTEKMFMEANESLLKNGVDALAHPFRYFRRAGTPAPGELFRELALMLKSYGAAAEVNFHLNEPPVDFFKICLAEGVKISIGTDTHNLMEAGDLSRHIEFLGKLGISPVENREMFFVL